MGFLWDPCGRRENQKPGRKSGSAPPKNALPPKQNAPTHVPHPKNWTCRGSNPGLKKSVSNFYMLSSSLDLGEVQGWNKNNHLSDLLPRNAGMEQ